MRIGSLRHLVAIQSPSYTQDEYKQSVVRYTTVKEVYASIETLAGRELDRAKSIQAESTHKIAMRYTPVKPSDVILFNGRTFFILAVMNIEESNIELHLLCKEKV